MDFIYLQIYINTPCFIDFNMNQKTTGRIERAPLSAFSFFFSIVCIIGNTIVLHIFRTKYKKSNYRFFVLLLSSLDMGFAICFVMKEQLRIQNVYNGGTPVACPILRYFGSSVGMGTVLMVLFIAVERYKKICTPFQTQFTIAQCGRFCTIAMIVSAIVNVPAIFIFGKRDFIIEGINATRCDVLKKFDETEFSILYFGSLNTVTLVVVFCITVIQLKIRAVINRQSQLKKRMNLPASSKNQLKIAETPLSGEDGATPIEYEEKLSAIKIAVVSKEMTPMAKPNLSKTKKTNDELKAIKIAVAFCIITALLVISVQAMLINVIISAISRYLRPENEISKDQDIFNNYFLDIAALNGMFNPFVYYFFDNKFRQEVRKLCRR